MTAIIISVLIVLIFLGIMFLVVLVYYNSKKNKLIQDKISMQSQFQQTLLQTQLEIQEQTFKNISLELHDNIGQALSFIKLNINTINIDETVAAKEKLIESKTLLTSVIQDLRDLSKTLNTDFINEIGLPNAIQQQLDILQKTGIYQTQLLVTGEEKKYQLQRELVVYRIVQELLNNIVKHADASMISIVMDYHKEKLLITVTDNGKGFEATAENTGLGLRNMLNRMSLIKGFITINSKPGEGTMATIELPGKEASI